MVHLRGAVIADEQPAELVQPGEGALDHPAVDAEARAVLAGPLRYDRLGVPPPELTTVAAVVVAPV